MSYRLRAYLFSFFTILFLIATPLTILYISGYKVDFKNLRVSKTGGLIVKSEPDRAKIFLDDKLRVNRLFGIVNPGADALVTPARIMNLLPGEYSLRIEQEGYWNWSKKINIYPNKTTIIDDILLIKKDIPIIIDEQAGPDLLATRQADKIFYQANGRLKYYEPSSDSIQPFSATSSAETAPGLLSPGEARLLAGTTVYIVADKSAVDLSGLLPINALNLIWDDESDYSILFNAPTFVGKINLPNMSLETVYRGTSIEAFTAKKNMLYILESGERATSLIVHDPAQGKIERKIDLPGSPTYKFINRSSQYLNLHDYGRQILYIIEPDAFSPLKEIINNVKTAEWISADQLLCSNEHEIFIFDMADNRKKIMTRVSENIDAVTWHPSGKYIIYSSNGSLYSMESSGAIDININELIKLNSIKNLIIGNNGKLVYFYGQIGNQAGLYMLSL